MYKHSDPFIDAMIYCDDCDRADREHERRVAECEKQVDACFAELEKYKSADIPEFCNSKSGGMTVLEMLDHLDPDSFYECVSNDFNDMAETDLGKVRSYDKLIDSAKARLREYFDKKINER